MSTALAAPTLTRVETNANGYALVGSGFGSDKTKVEVFEGATKLAADKIVSMKDSVIIIASKPTGTVNHKVKVAGQESQVVSFTHQAAAKAASTATAAAAGPKLTTVRTTGDGYTLVGSGFGSDKTKVEVFEGATKLTADKILSMKDHAIDTASKPTGTVNHKVKVAGQESQAVSFTHQAAAKAASTATGATAGPRTLTLSSLQATGYRQEAPPARSLTLGTLSATGYRAEPPAVRSLTLGTLSAEGYRE